MEVVFPAYRNVLLFISRLRARHNGKITSTSSLCAEIERDIPRILYPPTFSYIPIFHRDMAGWPEEWEIFFSTLSESSYSIARYKFYWETISALYSKNILYLC